MKKIGWIATLSAGVLALAGSASVAFEEQKAAQQASPAPAAAAAASGQTVAPAAKPEGTEIRIPGLGKLGTLPKMDFGLELLYGAAETEKVQEPSKIDDQQDDLTVKGSIKHKF